MENARAEYWGSIQRDLYVQNTAFYLANRDLEDVITGGRKLHKPILSHPQIGTYTAHSDISFSAKTAEDQYLEVDTFEYAAEELDDTEQAQTPYDLSAHSLATIRAGLMNGIEQKFLSQISNAAQSIASNPVLVSVSNILDIFEEAEGKLGAVDAPLDTNSRAYVAGPRTVAKFRNAKSNRETGLGDATLANGVVGPWHGFTVVQNNNLPYSAVLTMATNPTDGDTVTIAGVTFEFQDDLADVTAGNVGVLRDGSAADTSRAALAAAINDSGTAGTTYTQLDAKANLIIRRKRRITATNNNASDTLTIAGFGDIAVSETFTAAGNVWGSQTVGSVFMIRGAIDLAVQLMDLELARKEKGFAKLVKGLIGVGAKVFDDGAYYMVYMEQDASEFV